MKKFKKLISSFLAAALIFALLPMGVLDFSAKADVIGYFSYRIDLIQEYPYNEYRAIITYVSTNASGNIVVPASVDSRTPTSTITADAFNNCSKITSVDIPSSITSIGTGTFNGCTSLSSINVASGNQYYSSVNGVLFNKDKTTLIRVPQTKSGTYYIPSTVKTISPNAFEGCTALTSVSIPSSVTSIGSSAFSGCTSLSSIYIPDSVTSIGSSAFANCTALTKATIGSGVTSIGDSAFSGCNKITSINIPGSVTRIGNSAFEGCTSLSSINIPDSVTSIGSSAFKNCSKITSINIPSNVTSIGSYTFENCSSITSVSIPASATTIGSYAFRNCTSLASINLPLSVKTVGSSAFDGCTALKTVYYAGTSTNRSKINISSGNTYFSSANWKYSTVFADNFTVSVSNGEATIIGTNSSMSGSVTIPGSFSGYPVIAISSSAFSGNSKITAITIPDSVTSIDASTFNNCSALKSITVSSNNKNYSSLNGILFSKDQKTLIKYPEARTNTTCTLPNTVTDIEPYAFYKCNYLESASLGHGIKTLEEHVFYDCEKLNSVTFGNSLTYIEPDAFYNCAITNITIGNGVYVEPDAFLSCKKLLNIYVLDSNENYSSQDGILFNKSGTTLIVYPQARPETEYTISNSVTSIGYYAFFGCTALTNISIPKSATYIYDDAFWGCNALSNISVDLDNTKYSSQDGVLFNKDKTELLVYPNGKTETEYTIPESVTYINTYAFENCPAIETLTILNNKIRLTGSHGQFYGCRNLKKLVGVTPQANLSALFCVENNTDWDEINYVPSSLKEVVIAGEGSISTTAYKNCSSITSITIKGGVTEIGEGAFNGCSSLQSVIIEEGVTTIGTYAFYNCFALKNISIPKSMTAVAVRAFNTCSALKDVYYRGTNKANITFATGNDPLVNATWHYSSCIGTAEHSYDNNCDTTCNVCSFVREVEPHSYVDTIVPPTDTEMGYTEHVCSICGDSYRDSYTGKKVYGVKVEATDIDVTVSWNAYEGADRYIVKVLNPDGSAFATRTITDGSLSTVFKGLEFDTEYTVFVVARVGGKWQSADVADQFKTSLVLGNRVVGIKSSVKGRTITVNWMAYPGATQYYVFVYPKGADATVSANRVTSINAGNKTTVDIINAIAPETDYDIYVSARVGGKYQTLENALFTSAVIPVTAPNSFEITSIEPTIVRIKWNAVKNADRYWARLVDENGNVVMTKQSLKALISFTGLTPGVTYYVQLQARVPKSSGGNQYSGYCDPIETPITMPLH